MFPDAWGSDYDYDHAMGHAYEPSDWCIRHGQRAESCGPCWHEARDDDEHEFWARATAADDEQRGVA